MILYFNKLFFNVNYINSTNILCCIIILICIILCLILQNKKVNKKFFNTFSEKIIFTGTFVAVFLPLLTVFMSDLNASKLNGPEVGSLTLSAKIPSKNKINIAALDNLDRNHIIIVGDSRMRFLADDEKVKIPSNFSFIAKGGAKIDWLTDVALLELEKKLNNVLNEENLKVLKTTLYIT